MKLITLKVKSLSALMIGFLVQLIDFIDFHLKHFMLRVK